MAVIGTCVSMIIGEDLVSAIDSAGITTPTIAVDIHAGFPENISARLRPSTRQKRPVGSPGTNSPASTGSWKRQTRLKKSGRRIAGIHRTVPGDLKHVAAQRLIACAKSGAKGVAILNAKKETAYMFADEADRTS